MTTQSEGKVARCVRSAYIFLRNLTNSVFRSSEDKALTQTFKSNNIKSLLLKDAFPGIEDTVIFIMPIRNDDECMSLQELTTLCAICKHLRPRKVFEFGTFKGNSTLHLALNSPQDCEIFTLDLSPDCKIKTRYPIEIGPITGMPFIVGEKYHGTIVEHKIKQLYGDSAEFDYTKFLGSIDLVLIDGNHQYYNVKSDSENAFRLLSPTGLIIWHDYTPLPEHRGVSQYLNELACSLQLYKIQGTSFVFTQKSGR